MEVALDQPRMFDVGRSAFEDVRQQHPRHAAELRRNFRIEMALQRRQSEQVICHDGNVGTFRIRNRRAAL